jgi:membrane associated rhomboid family serine protease
MTYLFIIITALISITAFFNKPLFYRMQFNPYAIRHQNEWFRFITYGLIHVNWIHLLINMFVLLSFGLYVEGSYREYFESRGTLYYILLYVGGIIFSVLYDYGKHRNDEYYNAVGASGAVSAVVFTYILFNPTGKLYLYFIPIGIPAVIFGALYLVYSAYMARRGSDHVGHYAHFWGAIFGMVFTILLKPAILLNFYHQIVGMIR